MELIKDSKTNICISVVILIILIGLLCHSCVDAIVKTVETEEEQRIFRAKIYEPDGAETPKAFRMASPTQEQMEHYHHLLQVMEVRR